MNKNIFSTISIGLVLNNFLFDASASNRKETDKAENQRPNILFCIADDASFMHFSKYGCSWVNTPNFDRIANQGILFQNAYTCNAKSAPSRACVLTGRNSWQLEEAGNHIGYWPVNKYRTYMEALSANGYTIGFTGKGWKPGDPGLLNGKPRLLTGKSYSSKNLIPPTSQISSNDYSSNFQDFLNSAGSNSPWCFWLGTEEPHRAYEFKSGVKKGGKSLLQIDKVPAFWPDNDSVRNDMLDYAFELEYFDKQLGYVIKVLEDKGILQNTIIVVTSDNGMPFPRAKGIQYDYSNHMPLAIMWPNGIKNPGRIETGYVSFIDIAPTFIEIAGVNPQVSGMEPMQGKSLTDIFQNQKTVDRSFVLLGQERHDVGRPKNQGYPIRSIIEDGFLYVHNFKPELWPMANPETGYLNTDGSPTKSYILNMRRRGVDKSFWQLNFGKHPQEELYNLTVDRECLINLAQDTVYKSRKEALKNKLFENLILQQDPRVLGNGDVFDNYQLFQVNMRSFYERYMNGEIKDFITPWVSITDYEKEIINDFTNTPFVVDSNKAKVYGIYNNIIILNANKKAVKIYSLTGSTLVSKVLTSDSESFIAQKGTYFVSVNNQNVKVIIN